MTSPHWETELALASEGPPRLLAGGTAFEQLLLQAASSEPVPDAALQRLARALNAPFEPAAGSVPGSAVPGSSVPRSSVAAGGGAAKSLSRWITAGVLGGIGLVAPLIASHWRTDESTEQRAVPEELSPAELTSPRAQLNPAPDMWPLTVTDAPAQHTAAEAVTVEPSVPRPASPAPPRRERHASPSPRAARAAAEKAPQPAPDRSLRAELRALEAIQQTLAAGRAADAARALERYHEQFPGGELALEAELLGVDVALGTGQKRLARQRAAALLARGDGARYRDRLNALLKHADERIETNAAPHERAEVVQP